MSYDGQHRVMSVKNGRFGGPQDHVSFTCDRIGAIKGPPLNAQPWFL
jgi:hypothetical protein